MLDNLDDAVLKCPTSKAVMLFFLSFCADQPFFRVDEFLLKSISGVKTYHWLSTIDLGKKKLCWRLSLYSPDVVMQLYKRLAFAKQHVFAEIRLDIPSPHAYMIGFDEAGVVRQTINGGEYVISGAENVKFHTPNEYAGVIRSIDLLVVELKRTIKRCQDEAQE